MAFNRGMTIDLCMAYMLRLVTMNLTLMQGHSGLADDKLQRWIISTTKQAISIKHAATVGHDIFYFSLKSSVAFVLNYGDTSISYNVIRHTYAMPAFQPRFWCRDERCNWSVSEVNTSCQTILLRSPAADKWRTQPSRHSRKSLHHNSPCTGWTKTIIVIYRAIFKLRHSTLEWCSFRWPWPWCKVTVGLQRQINRRRIISTAKQALSIKLTTTVGPFLRERDFENVYMAEPTCSSFCRWRWLDGRTDGWTGACSRGDGWSLLIGRPFDRLFQWLIDRLINWPTEWMCARVSDGWVPVCECVLGEWMGVGWVSEWVCDGGEWVCELCVIVWWVS